MQLGSEVVIAVSDDGRGIDVSRVRRLPVAPTAAPSRWTTRQPFTSSSGRAHHRHQVTGVSGRGVGSTPSRQSNAVRGRIEVRSDPGMGTEFRIAVATR